MKYDVWKVSETKHFMEQDVLGQQTSSPAIHPLEIIVKGLIPIIPSLE